MPVHNYGSALSFYPSLPYGISDIFVGHAKPDQTHITYRLTIYGCSLPQTG